MPPVPPATEGSRWSGRTTRCRPRVAKSAWTAGGRLREQPSVGEHPGKRHHCARFVPLDQARTTVPGNRLLERALVRDEPGTNSSLGAHHLQDRLDRLQKHRKA